MNRLFLDSRKVFTKSESLGPKFFSNIFYFFKALQIAVKARCIQISF